MTAGFPKMELDASLAAEITEKDYEGIEATIGSLPTVSICQKPVTDDKGRTLFNPGGFKVHDRICKSHDIVIPHVAGDVGIEFTILMDRTTRTYWPEGDFGKPHCNSVDSFNGIGKPGGNCAICPLSQFIDGERPDCSEYRKALVWDHNTNTCYILQFGRSALRLYDDHKAFIAKLTPKGGMKIPLLALKLRVTTKYIAEIPGKEYFEPIFEIVEQIPLEQFRVFRQICDDMRLHFKVASIVTVDEEHPTGGSATGVNDPGGEIPPDTSEMGIDPEGRF